MNSEIILLLISIKPAFTCGLRVLIYVCRSDRLNLNPKSILCSTIIMKSTYSDISC